MRALTYTIELLQPLLATGFEGDPNSGVSLDYVPGSVIRGALIARYLRQKKAARSGAEIDPADPMERALFFDGTVRYLNAYPLVREEIGNTVRELRSLPLPLSWHRPKEAKEEEGTSYEDYCWTEPQEDYKAASSPFFAFARSDVYPVRLEHRLAVHTQREPRKGRAIEGEGAVFRYVSIAKGTRFIGAIVCHESLEKDVLDKTLRGLLENRELTLGGSRTGGYGRARVLKTELKDWLEQPDKPTVITAGAPFTVTLLSPALIRDGHGQLQTELALYRDEHGRLQTYQENDFDKVADLVGDKTFKRAELTGGFNRKWGLPLPQAVAIKAGSVFTFTATKELAAAELQKWLDEGIGERRLDGFGRIAINLSTAPTLSIRRLEARPEAVALTSEHGKTIGKTLIKRLLRQRFEEQLVKRVGEYKLENAPRNHQISRLRLVLREAQIGQDTKLVDQFFSQMKKAAHDQFEGARVDRKNLRAWVQATLQDESLFKEPPITLGKDTDVVSVASKDVQELRREYRIRLIDQVLARAAKDNQ